MSILCAIYNFNTFMNVRDPQVLLLILKVLKAINACTRLSEETQQKHKCVCDFMNTCLVYCETSNEETNNPLADLKVVKGLEDLRSCAVDEDDLLEIDSLLKSGHEGDTSQMTSMFQHVDPVDSFRYRAFTIKKMAATIVSERIHKGIKSRRCPFLFKQKDPDSLTKNWITEEQKILQKICDDQEVEVNVEYVYSMVLAEYIVHKQLSEPIFLLDDDDKKEAEQLAVALYHLIVEAGGVRQEPISTSYQKICAFAAMGGYDCRCRSFKHKRSEIDRIDEQKLMFCATETLGILCECPRCYNLHIWNLKQYFVVRHGKFKFQPAKSTDFVHMIIAASHFKALGNKEKRDECLEILARNMYMNNFIHSIWDILFE